MQGLPRVVLNLLHPQADTSRFWIDAQDFHFDPVTGIHDLAGMFDPLRPAHFRNMNQSFDSVLQFNEGTVVRDAGDSSGHSRADRETLFHTRPGIRLTAVCNQEKRVRDHDRT